MYKTISCQIGSLHEHANKTEAYTLDTSGAQNTVVVTGESAIGLFNGGEYCFLILTYTVKLFYFDIK